MKIVARLFPDLVGKRFLPIDLNAEAKRWFSVHGVTDRDPNPLNEPETCEVFARQLQERSGGDFLYGGYLEDRSAIWRGTYLDHTGDAMHLGVDVAVPHRTLVAVPCAGEVLRIDSDVPEPGGWGTRILIRSNDAIFYFAHLDPDVFVSVGRRLSAGSRLGCVGHAPENGGWWPHLHVQAVDRTYFSATPLEEIDGYGRAADLELLRKRFPDPLFLFDQLASEP